MVLENFNKNLGFGQTPPPLVGPNAQLFPKMHFEGSPKGSNEKAQSPKNSAMGGGGVPPFPLTFVRYLFGEGGYPPFPPRKNLLKIDLKTLFLGGEETIFLAIFWRGSVRQGGSGVPSKYSRPNMMWSNNDLGQVGCCPIII